MTALKGNGEGRIWIHDKPNRDSKLMDFKLIANADNIVKRFGIKAGSVLDVDGWGLLKVFDMEVSSFVDGYWVHCIRIKE